MGRATAVLARPRVAAFLLLAAAVGSYYAWRDSIPELSVNWELAVLCFPIVPAVFGLILLALPLWRAPGLPLFLLFALSGAAAIGLELADLRVVAVFAKLCCYAAFGLWAIRFFEEVWWAVLIACIVPLVDAFSVFNRHGPTHTITEHHFDTFLRVAVTFALPHGRGAQIGPPDVIFFALFLAAADRFRLRVVPTFVAMVALLGGSFIVAIAWNKEGLPALVPLSLGFLGANADVLWRRYRTRPELSRR